MAITKQKKVEIVANATATLKGAVSAAFVSFTKLTVAEVNEMRAALRAEGVKYTVVKKTLLKRALQDINTTGDVPEMPGEIAMAVLPSGAGTDVTAPARGVQAFVKKFKEKLVFVGGVIDGAFLSAADTKAVATIPPVPVLRGMFANVINSPIQRFAIGLAEVAKIK
jgi:large subunit ribosomal protein L10